jgi:hypothetical protein
MNLEDQVCSLKLAKRLKELNVRQESYFVYAKEILVPEFRYGGYAETRPDIWKLIETLIYSAFTVSELGEMLPANINSWGLCFDATSCATENGIKSLWHVTYADYDKKLMNEISDLNLANACGKMLIHLIENKLIEIPK